MTYGLFIPIILALSKQSIRFFLFAKTKEEIDIGEPGVSLSRLK